MQISYSCRETCNHYLKISAALSYYNYSTKCSLRQGRTDFQTALERTRVCSPTRLDGSPRARPADRHRLQSDPAFTNREHNFRGVFPRVSSETQRATRLHQNRGETCSRTCSTLSVPTSSNPVLFTLQSSPCPCTWGSSQPGSATGEGEGWGTPRSCSDLHAAHHRTRGDTYGACL